MPTMPVDALETILGELRSAGETADPGLLERARSLGGEAVGPLIAMAVDWSLHQAPTESPEVWAPIHAIHVLGELGAEQALEPLLSLLDDDDVDDALSHALEKAFAGIGAPALEPLRARFLDGSRSVLSRYPLARCIAAIGREKPELRAPAIGALVDRLDAAHSQVPEDEQLNAFAVCALGDLRAVEAEAAIRQAFAGDRVDTIIVGLDDVLLELGVAEESAPPAPQEGLRLNLCCSSCHYPRPHQVRRVYLDLTTWERHDRGEKTKYDAFVIPERIQCHRCGAVDQYTFTGDAHLALTAELLRMRTSGQDPAGALRITRFTRTDGRCVHPLEARDRYREQVAASPGRPDLRVRYGNVLATLGYHEEARAEYQAAVELQATNAEAWLNLGSLAWQAGDEAEGRRMIEEAIAAAPHDVLSEERRAGFVRMAREALDGDPTALQGMHTLEPCPAELKRRVEPESPAEPESRVELAARAVPFVREGPKVGRNEPCPCGSGKKHKRCCGG